jgi:hypothetical protein
MSQGQRNRGSGGAQPLPKPYDFRLRRVSNAMHLSDIIATCT